MAGRTWWLVGVLVGTLLLGGCGRLTVGAAVPAPRPSSAPSSAPSTSEPATSTSAPEPPPGPPPTPGRCSLDLDPETGETSSYGDGISLSASDDGIAITCGDGPSMGVVVDTSAKALVVAVDKDTARITRGHPRTVGPYRVTLVTVSGGHFTVQIDKVPG